MPPRGAPPLRGRVLERPIARGCCCRGLESHVSSAPRVTNLRPAQVENFAKCIGSVAAITAENEHLLKSGYAARTDKELPVLQRWFPEGTIEPPQAKYLDVILYSREQIRKENAAMGEDSNSDAPWGIVSVKAQDVDTELPMQPITVMRNALGADEGGSGVPLDADKYRASVAYWAKNAPIQ